MSGYNLYAKKPVCPLKFKKGNFGELEAASPEYVASMEKWSAAYTGLCSLYNETEAPDTTEARKAEILGMLSNLKVKINHEMYNEGFEPRDHQIPIIQIGINTNRLAIYAGLGSGKTMIGGSIAVNALKYGILKNSGKTFVISCPKSASREWSGQLATFFKDVTTSTDIEDVGNVDFFITTFDSIHKLEEVKNKICGLIVDECQNIQNIYSLRFKNILSLIDKNVNVRIILSGTPMANNSSEMFGQLSLINPFAFAFSAAHMTKTCFTQIKFMNRRGSMAKFKAEFIPLFAKVVSRNSVKCETPERHSTVDIKVIPFSASVAQQGVLDTLRKDTLEFIDSSEYLNAANKNPAIENIMMKETQVSSGFLITEFNTTRFESSKMKYLYSLLSDEWGSDQVVVWTYLRETTAQLLEHFGHEAMFINGSVSQKQREVSIDAFVNGNKRIAILQLKAANSALNLQNCSKMVFAELAWTANTIDQAIGRIDRPGQLNNCDIRLLYTRDTTDECMLTAYNNKSKISARTLINFIRAKNLKFK